MCFPHYNLYAIVKINQGSSSQMLVLSFEVSNNLEILGIPSFSSRQVYIERWVPMILLGHG